MDSIGLKRILPRVWRSLLRPWSLLLTVLFVTLFTCGVLLSAPASIPPDGQHPALPTRAAGYVALDLQNSLRLRENARLHHPPPVNKVDSYQLFLRRPIINPHNFSYILNEADACRDKPIHLVITTPSAPANFFRRMMARKASANVNNSVTRHLFFLGATADLGIQAKVAIESQRFKDIVQESYVDVYRNITYKAVQMLRWVSEACPHSRYVIRLDDDVTADVVKIVETMAVAQRKYDNFILGDVKVGWVPCQIPKCKTTKAEYPHATLPPFALGGALGYPTSTVKRLYEAVKRVKWFKLDDVYVTGMCAPLVNVTLLKDTHLQFQHDAW